MDIFLEKHFDLARLGKKNWDDFEENNTADKYIILPHVGDEYNKWAAYFLDAYMKKERAKNVIIIAASLEDLKLFPDKEGIKKIQQSEEWIESILKYYALFLFSNRLTIISLTKPYDTCGNNLIGVNGITKKELLCFDIYGFQTIPII